MSGDMVQTSTHYSCHLVQKSHKLIPHASKRVFILGPSHHHYLSRCALSQCTSYETPLGNLQLDLSTIAELHKTGQFERMSIDVDEAEHSIEMQLPYVYKILSRYAPTTPLSSLPHHETSHKSLCNPGDLKTPTT